MKVGLLHPILSLQANPHFWQLPYKGLYLDSSQTHNGKMKYIEPIMVKKASTPKSFSCFSFYVMKFQSSQIISVCL